MNRKQFTLLLVLVVVIGLAGLFVYNKQNDVRKEGDPSLGQKLLGEFPYNDVALISIKQGSNELNLVKKDNLWRVREREEYPANYGEISGFLLKARDLKIGQSERVGPSQLSRFALVPGEGSNAALVVEFKDSAGKTLQSVLLGKKHMRKSTRPSPYGDEGEGWPDGRYVKVGNSDRVVLINEALANIEPKPEQWLNKDFFKVERIRSIAVTYAAETNSWKLARETETSEWKLAEAKPAELLDAGKASSLSGSLGNPSFNDAQPLAKAADYGIEKGTVVQLDTFDNFAYTLKIGAKTNDVYPVTLSVAAQLVKERTPGKDEKAEDKAKLDKEFKDKVQKLEEKLNLEKAYEKWVYLVSSWTFESLLKERAQLLQEKKEEPKKEDEKPAAVAAPDASPLEPPAAPAKAP